MQFAWKPADICSEVHGFHSCKLRDHPACFWGILIQFRHGMVRMVSGEVGPAENSAPENSAPRRSRPPENSAPSDGELGPINRRTRPPCSRRTRPLGWRTRPHSVAVWHGFTLLCIFYFSFDPDKVVTLVKLSVVVTIIILTTILL